MRAFALLLVLAVLAVSVSGVAVPYKWCGGSSDSSTIDSIQSNEFPPVKGDYLSLNVTGNLTKQVTDGTYDIAISLGGFPLPSVTGNISAFHPLPWSTGELNFTYTQEIPSEAPGGNYQVKISAVDQDKKQIFCITIAFTLSSAAVDNVHQGRLRLGAVQSTVKQLLAEHMAGADVEDDVVVNQRSANARLPRMQNPRLRRNSPIKSIKPLISGRRL